MGPSLESRSCGYGCPLELDVSANLLGRAPKTEAVCHPYTTMDDSAVSDSHRAVPLEAAEGDR